MHDRGIFVFGADIIHTDSRDNVSSLPLELSWRIFSFLDGTALRNASFAYKKWKRIIICNKKLRRRLNSFELSIVLGSKSLMKFHKKNKKILRRERKKNYLPKGECSAQTMKITVVKSKRGGDDIFVHTKRFKLF
ncbi:uncharacterized protein LOC114359257 [Ostrinia furnacalis]|uniref:uncharacterized protein LOC114359257 n=1 Tax=Ostrinia furnacalis TaxID=93504 RepID=UPI00103B88D5|nr:uncharacterized protein LOC114359257 [Ostrinia furnacalis]